MNNKKQKIGIFDSGLGGLSILKELRKLLPNEDYLFYEDSINNPYGEKTIDELIDITSNIVDYLLENDCKIIVIACNTATTCCMKKLRKKYPDVLFVGTVPAIKVAHDRGFKYTILLSTPNTMKSKRVDELMNDFVMEDQVLLNISGENLANLIEDNKVNEIDLLLERLLSDYKDKADSVVLGCTHYPLSKDRIQKILPNSILLDSSFGASKEVKRQLENHNILNDSKEKGSLQIINSKDQKLIDRSLELLEK